MTTTQIEHLKLIDAHLERLLEIASKRTPGEWQKASRVETNDIIGKDEICGGVYIASVSRIAWGGMDSEHGDGNAAFIASAAGNAEAGWRATREAIQNGLSALNELGVPQPGYPSPVINAVEFVIHQLESILAAFPLESLKP